MILSGGFNLNVAIVVDGLFPTPSLVGEVDILPQSQCNLCVVIFHLEPVLKFKLKLQDNFYEMRMLTKVDKCGIKFETT